jgi:hypothetical protein
MYGKGHESWYETAKARGPKWGTPLGSQLSACRVQTLAALAHEGSSEALNTKLAGITVLRRCEVWTVI